MAEIDPIMLRKLIGTLVTSGRTDFDTAPQPLASLPLITSPTKQAVQPADLSGTIGLQRMRDLVYNLAGSQPPPERVDTDVAPNVITATPTTSSISSKNGIKSLKLKEEPDPQEMYIETVDVTGKPITLFSATDKMRSASEFADALEKYDKKEATPGFLVLPTNSFQETTRKGFEEGAGRFARETLPAAGEAVGGIAAMSPIMMLLQKAGIISPQTANVPIQAGRGGGRAIGQFIGEQFDTPVEAGMAAGTGAVAPFLPGVTSGTNTLLKLPLIGNALATGAAGLVGTTAMRAATGEELSPAQAIVDFAIPAVAGTAQGLVSHWITKYITNRNGAEKVAKGIIDTFKTKHPQMSAFDNVLDIATSSADDISTLTQQMSKGLRENADDYIATIIPQLNQTLPSRLSVGQQNEIRGQLRSFVRIQNKQLDNIDNAELFEEAGRELTAKIGDITESLRGYFPKVKNIDPTLLRAEGVLNTFRKEARQFDEAALVLHYLKQSGAAEGLDFNKFAQLIRGKSQENPGNMLDQVGRILGQGRPLTQMSRPEAPQRAPSTAAEKAADYMMGKLGPIGKALTLRDTPSNTPWPNPGQRVKIAPGKTITGPGGIPMRPLVNFGIQESGQQALRSIDQSRAQ